MHHKVEISEGGKPLDADDAEPCKACEAIADSEQYVPVMTYDLVELEERLTNSE